MNELDDPKSTRVLTASGNEFENSSTIKALGWNNAMILNLNTSSL